jgi:DMSO/TMAO reductase YedYZ molybdopterin-dependent catalytic subunit
MSGIISRGFLGRRRPGDSEGQDAPRKKILPPGQYETRGFPVLSAGPTPHTPLAEWDFSIIIDGEVAARWDWDEFRKLKVEQINTDIHCVTRWSKFDTNWEGVALDTLLEGIDHDKDFLLAFSDGGYTTNLPLEDVTGGRAWIAFNFEGEPLDPEHGGPARLLVPHLYFWKSAKWVRGIRLMDADEPGFWEELGYHMYGDPWKEQRFWGD